jgi:hypothetical protein
MEMTMNRSALKVACGLTCLVMLAGTSYSAGPGKGGSSHPAQTQPGHSHPGHVRPGGVLYPTYRPAYVAPVVVEASWQQVRYLRVSNQSGDALTVYVRTGDGETRRWNFAADAVAYLALDNEWLTASEVFIWGRSGSRSWNGYQAQPLVMVAEPYQATAIETYTYTFNP